MSTKSFSRLDEWNDEFNKDDTIPDDQEKNNEINHSNDSKITSSFSQGVSRKTSMSDNSNTMFSNQTSSKMQKTPINQISGGGNAESTAPLLLKSSMA